MRRSIPMMADQGILPQQPAVLTEIVSKARNFFREMKSKIYGGEEEYITFEEAISILRLELNYPAEKALHFVRRFDRNNDGRLSMAEFNLFRKKIEETKVQIVPMFKQYDIDGNGYITLEEASSILQGPPFNFPPAKVIGLLQRFDKDGNGQLDIEEFAGFYSEAKATFEDITTCFDQLDKDGNGVLSPEEVATIIQEKMGFDENMARHLVQMFDQNQDGSLDKAEFIQLWTSMFGQ